MNHTESNTATEINNSELLNDLIIDAIEEGKGKGIKKIDLRKLEEASTDFYIICTGLSSTQISGIVGRIAKRVKEELGINPSHSEGTASWMLLDYFSTIVHIFPEEKRAFYNLDDLWSDGIITEY